MSPARSIFARVGRVGRRAQRPGAESAEAADDRLRVLITGAAGLIGTILRESLRDEFVVRGLDVAGAPDVDWAVDMRDLRRAQPAFDGVDAVVDLAATSSVSASWEEVRGNNIPATLNTLEAARCAGVTRVVLASSNHASGMSERDEPYASVVAGRYDGLDPARLPRLRADAPPRPDGPYGVGKVFSEAAARFYADEHGLSVLCLRIGTVNREDRPNNPRHFATLLTHRDLAHLVRCCLHAPPAIRFGVFYGVSANTWRLWDIDDARDAIAYQPQDDAESWRSNTADA